MKNVNVILIIVVLTVAIVAIILSDEVLPSKSDEPQFFTNEPTGWIYDNPSTTDTDVLIDVYMASKGTMRLAKDQQDLFIDNDILSFFYEGMYRGEFFDSEYLPLDFFNRTKGLSLSQKRAQADLEVKMQIINEFKVDDGIIQGFILAREENNRMVFYIFIDEDFKSELEFINILWGDDFSDIDTLNIKEFDFTKSEEGVYVDVLNMNVDWFERSSRKGGIIVGEINKESIINLYNQEYLDITYMMVK